MATHTFEVDDFLMTVKTRGGGEGEDAPPVTMQSVTVRLRDADRQLHGVTGGMLRRAADRLPHLLDELQRTEQGSYRMKMWRRQADAAVAKMEGREPRGDDTYHRDLLRAVDMLRRAGEREPLAVLAERLDLSRGTVKSRTHRARELDKVRREAGARQMERMMEDARVRAWHADGMGIRDVAQRWEDETGEEVPESVQEVLERVLRIREQGDRG